MFAMIVNLVKMPRKLYVKDRVEEDRVREESSKCVRISIFLCITFTGTILFSVGTLSLMCVPNPFLIMIYSEHCSTVTKRWVQQFNLLYINIHK